MREYAYIGMRVRPGYFKRFRKTRSGLLILFGIIVCMALVHGLSNSDSSGSQALTQNSGAPDGSPYYCAGDDPDNPGDSYIEGLIEENCPQDITVRQALYSLNQDYAAGDITTIPYPWCVPGQVCKPTSDMTGPTVVLP